MAIIAARRLSTADVIRDQAHRAVAWLIGCQKPDGAWPTIAEPGADGDIFSTALALNAVAFSDHSGRRTVCERAGVWLLAQQEPVGWWRRRSVPPVPATVTVLEALRAIPMADFELPGELVTGVTLLRRAELLSREHSSDGRQLAVIGAYTGLESILYALLGQPSVGRPTVRPDGKTIGFDQALTETQDALRQLGHLAPTRLVHGHDELRKLTHVRDGVVHRGTQPSSADVARITGTAVAFCRAHIPHRLGIDVFAD